MPLVGVAAADAGEIRPGALRAPLERVVVHALGGEAVVAVALDLVAERADHLAVADVAALADVDVAAGQLERRVGPHALDLLDRVLRDRTAARSRRCRRWSTTRSEADEQQRGVAFSMTSRVYRACPSVWLLTRPAAAAGEAAGASAAPARWSPRIVMPDVVGHDQRAGEVEQRRRARGSGSRDAWPPRSRRRSRRGSRASSYSRHIRPCMMPATHIADGVENDAEGREPEVPVDQAQASRAARGPTAAAPGSRPRRRRSCRPSRARRNGRGRWSSRCSGLSELTALIDIIGPSKVDMP